MSQHLILKNSLSPGDIVMLTAAVRDLHQCYPGQFVTDVRTPYPHLWAHNPYITPLHEHDSNVRVIDCHYPLIQHSNQRPYHFIHGFIAYLNEQLTLEIKPTAFKGDIYISPQESRWYSQVHEIIGDDRPFWLIASGGKTDFTNKWWDPTRYQEVVDCFRGRICFVQVGRIEDHHPALDGVIDLRGKTDLRQLIRLVYHSQGVLCPVTALMHLAAAVPNRQGRPNVRPCVVVGGGREPSQWEAYPNHQFIHTIGALPCCQTGGCWKSRAVPLGDGDEKDRPQNLCVNTVRSLPKCMDMITSAEVVRRIELYFIGGVAEYLDHTLGGVGELVIGISWEKLSANRELTPENAAAEAEDVIKSIPQYPKSFRGRGIVICAGGVQYFTNAWVCINMLRRLGCGLPIQLWYQGPSELDDTMRSLVRTLNVQCVDADDFRNACPCKGLTGWTLKPYAILNSPFKEVLLLDADNVPLIDPESLFENVYYKETGAVFWPDFGRLSPSRPVWEIFGVPFHNEQEFESGQVLVNKEKCWRSLMLTMWYNANAAFFYSYVHGDKETFHLAFRKLNQPYSLVPHRIVPLLGTMCQHDFNRSRIFQHRNQVKWVFRGENRRVPGFLREDECLGFIETLRKEWNGSIASYRRVNLTNPVAQVLTENSYILKTMPGKEVEILFSKEGEIQGPHIESLRRWDLRSESDGSHSLLLYGETGLAGELAVGPDGIWRSKWTRFDSNPLVLSLNCRAVHRLDMSDRPQWQQIYEDNIYRLPERFHENDIIIDIGANTGAFACACIARGGQYIHAFEPNDEACRLAVSNIRKWFCVYNPLRAHMPVCVEKVVVWPANEAPLVFGDERQTTTNDNCNPSGLQFGRGRQSFDLDLLLQELSHVALIRLDCGGSEYPILFHSKLLSRAERILVHLHDSKTTRANSHGQQGMPYSSISLIDHITAQGFVISEKADPPSSRLLDSPCTTRLQRFHSHPAGIGKKRWLDALKPATRQA